ncbi:KAP family P-loop NTPase fold protein [Paucidesulfovibrio longus]|uniref:KAP family P-loop NTPase fold protein n=1 Tax=Paucidesulfovibrio longus TaxID=889 RepID=UPI0003B4502B|nr:P-loop NTPase fold protein [Paucidesulfovibrio longus]
MFPTLPDIDINSIDSDKPWEKDQLDRQTQIAPLERLLLSVTDRPMTLALDSGWGTGKSSLLAMWSASLRKKGHPCVLFNAWNTDYAVDPLVAFVEELTTQLDQQRIFQKDATKIKALTNKLRARPLDLIATLAKVLARCVGADVDGLIDACRLDKEMDFVTAHQEQKQYMEDFRKQLGELVEKISKSKKHQIPMVIFVDELDRCRPDYAVKLLERIKHLFNVKGIIFVLAVDRNHLVQSVNQLYGLGESGSDAYLRRFIDLDYHLPDPSWEKFVSYVVNAMNISLNFGVIQSTTREHEESEFWRESTIEKMLCNIFTAYTPSLRDAVQVCSQISVLIRAYDPAPFAFATALLLLTISKADNRNIASIYSDMNFNIFLSQNSPRPNHPEVTSYPFNYWYTAIINYLNAKSIQNFDSETSTIAQNLRNRVYQSGEEHSQKFYEFITRRAISNERPILRNILNEVGFASQFTLDTEPQKDSRNEL